jgi:glycosyltransferase involved in cell wall biosynthesis
LARVSVVIAAYNAAKYIGETLESVLAQDYPDVEIVVVDDASTDDTGGVVRKFPTEKVRLLRLPENSGYAARPRNAGIRAATGSIIATCDADDLLTPGSLSARVDLLTKEPHLGLVFTDGVRFHLDGREEPLKVQTWRGHFKSIPRRPAGDHQFVIAAADAYHGLAVGNFVTPSGTLYPRSVFDEIGFYDETLKNGDDLEFYFRVARRYDIGYVDVVGYRYRLHAGAISARNATLPVSRIRVLERQLALGLAPSTRREIRKWIADNYTALGYIALREGRTSDARSNYLKSLTTRWSGASLRGYLTTLLGRRLYDLLRRQRG